jgi:hypothetical protein
MAAIHKIEEIKLSKNPVNTGEQFKLTVSLVTWDYLKKNYTWNTLKTEKTWGSLVERS